MKFPDHSLINDSQQWDRFCKLLWHDEKLGIWLDISKMFFKASDIRELEKPLQQAFVAINDLEAGSIANKDEGRMVGHYWLREPSLSPEPSISEEITNEINNIENFAENLLSGKILSTTKKKFTDVLWIGIGGSSLGPILIINSLNNYKSKLKFHFIDNIDPNGISLTLNNIDQKLETTLVVVVSKSGGTPEPRLSMNQVRHRMEEKSLIWHDHAIAITMKNSQLYKTAIEESWVSTFTLQDWVGGRTSITGAVGLLPAALIGVDIRNFLDGASQMDKITRNRNVFENPSALLASSWYLAGSGKGLRDMVVLPYRDQLEVFSRYLQQLVMESLGKKKDRKGNIVNQGLAVYGNKGSTDQHAYVQQLRDGIDNFFVTFIEILDQPNDIVSINNEYPGDFLSGFLHGTKAALFEGGRQSLTITINKFNEITLGSLIALFERAVSFYGELVNINAYHQPGVEAGKVAANELLSLQKKVEDKIPSSNSISIKEIMEAISYDSSEDIFMILRYLSHSSNLYIVQGDWNDPASLRFTKKG